jgi:hypothetical protein
LPGYGKLELLSKILVEVGSDESKLSINSETRSRIIEAWNSLEEHDKKPQNFRSAYQSRWGNTMYGRTKGDAAEATVTQKIKFNLRYTPAQLIDPKKNRLVYCTIKHLWLCHNKESTKAFSPDKIRIHKSYERIQHRVLVEDPILSKLGIPLPKINTKCIRDFMRRQEALASSHSTAQGSAIQTRIKSISSLTLPDTPKLPTTIEKNKRPEMMYRETICRAGQKATKKREDLAELESRQTMVKSEHNTSSLDSNSLQSSSTFIGIARSTAYKRRQYNNKSNPILDKYPRLNNPKCLLCKKPTQGHKKYKKKTWCEDTKQSSSKGLSNKTFIDFEHFKSEIDEL